MEPISIDGDASLAVTISKVWYSWNLPGIQNLVLFHAALLCPSADWNVTEVTCCMQRAVYIMMTGSRCDSDSYCNAVLTLVLHWSCDCFSCRSSVIVALVRRRCLLTTLLRQESSPRISSMTLSSCAFLFSCILWELLLWYTFVVYIFHSLPFLFPALRADSSAVLLCALFWKISYGDVYIDQVVTVLACASATGTIPLLTQWVTHTKDLINLVVLEKRYRITVCLGL